MESITHGTVTIEDIARIIMNRVNSVPGDYNVMVGTDSQNFDKTKMVMVIAVHHIGHGGFFFYDISYIRKISNIGQKLLYEASLSIELAGKLIEELDKLKTICGFDYSNRISIGIHVDIGDNGRSKQSIPEIVGWVKACGYDVITKPDSYAASSIANKISK